MIAVVRPGDSIAGAEAVENADSAAGISKSIRAGVLAASGERVLITLCDQPMITPEHLWSLTAVDAPIVASGYAGTIGVPAVFAARFASELTALTGDRCARSVIEAHRAEAVAVPFEEAAIDIDTLQDLIRLRSGAEWGALHIVRWRWRRSLWVPAPAEVTALGFTGDRSSDALTPNSPKLAVIGTVVKQPAA